MNYIGKSWKNCRILNKNIQLFKRQQWWREKIKRHKKVCQVAKIERKINYLRKKRWCVCLKEDQKESVKNNKLILKPQQRFKSERHNVFAEEINKIALSSNGDNECNQLIR